MKNALQFLFSIDDVSQSVAPRQLRKLEGDLPELDTFLFFSNNGINL